MLRYLLKRLASAIVTLWLLVTIVFLIVNILPGDIARKILGPFATQESVAAYRAEYGLDLPLWRQYLS